MNTLLDIIKEKKTNLVYTIRTTNLGEVSQILDEIGSSVCLIRFYSNLYHPNERNVLAQILIHAKKKYNFMLMEASTFWDLGNMLFYSLQHIKSYVDFVSLHGLIKNDEIQRIKEFNIGIFFIYYEELNDQIRELQSKFPNQIIGTLHQNNLILNNGTILENLNLASYMTQ